MIRLLAFDLDGTTITQNRYLSPKNREALLFARSRGVALVPATGRMRSFIPPTILELPGVRYVITSNGAAVYDLEAGSVLYEDLIDTALSRQVQAILDGYDVYIEYYKDGRAITKTGNPERARGDLAFPEEKLRFIDGKEYRFVDSYETLFEEGLRTEKINLPYLKPPVRRELWERLSLLPGLRLTSSMPENIEINAASANKGSALKFLTEKLGIPLSQVLAVGDNGNDVDMLRLAGYSAAVADGDPAARESARFITGPHDRDGLGEIIYRLLG